MSRPAPRSVAGGADELVDRVGVDDLCLARKDLLDEYAMDLGVAVEAEVFNDEETKISISRVAQCRQHHTAGRDARQDERVDSAPLQLLAKICRAERPDT